MSEVNICFETYMFWKFPTKSPRDDNNVNNYSTVSLFLNLHSTPLLHMCIASCTLSPVLIESSKHVRQYMVPLYHKDKITGGFGRWASGQGNGYTSSLQFLYVWVNCWIPEAQSLQGSTWVAKRYLCLSASHSATCKLPEKQASSENFKILL